MRTELGVATQPEDLGGQTTGDDAVRMPHPTGRPLRVALVHSFLISQGGGEKVLDALARMYPDAEIFTLILSRASLSPQLASRIVRSTLLDRFPKAARFYQHLSPLYDFASRRHRLDAFDLIISSGGPGVKALRLKPGAIHIHYCHSPVRFLWDQRKTWLARLPPVLRSIFAISTLSQRKRDFAAAQRIDAFIANSDYIGARIERYYQRDSVTIYPPVAMAKVAPTDHPGDYYLTVGRLVPGKRTELLIEACNTLGRKLVVVGTGSEEPRLRAIAGGTVTLAGRVSDADLVELYRNAKAFLFAADEDFGIATVEAQSYGLPSIAYGHGGSLEILSEGTILRARDAVLFPTQSAQAVIDAISRFEEIEENFDRTTIREHALRFSEAEFVRKMDELVTAQLRLHTAA